MDASKKIILIGFFLLGLAPFTATAMNGEQILRLKQAGVSDESIQLMIQEKSIETVSLTIQEVLEMKTAGMGEETLQSMIRGVSFLKNSQPVVYEIDRAGISITSARDLLLLKDAGFSEETIRALLTVAAGNKAHQDYERALHILDHLNIWISPPLPPKHCR